MKLMIDQHDIWNAIYNARNNRWHPPTSPNTAPATQNDCHDWSSSHIWNAIYNARNNRWHPPTSPNTAPATQNDSPKFQKHFSKTDETSITMRDRSELDPSWIRPWSENEFTVIRNPPRNRGYFSGPPRAFCIEKYNISRSGYHSKFHRILRLPRKVTLQLHRILRLPRKMTVMILSWLILVTYETLFTMRGTTGGILQHHQILRLPRKMTLQHFKEISRKQLKRHFQCGADPRMIRATSEQHPSRKPSAATRLATEVIFQDHHEHFVLKNTTFRAPAIIPNFTEYCACHEKWHFNFTEYCACHAKWLSWYCHDWSSSHMKRYLQCAEQQVASSNITKYCACHAKWLSWLILVTYIWNAIYNARNNRWHPPTSPNTAPATQNDSPKFQKHFSKTDETSITMRDRSELDPSWIRAGNRHPQPASQPRLLFRTTTSILYWKIQNFALRLSFQISPNTAPATKSDTSTSPNTAPATKSDTWTSPNNAPATKSDTWTSQNSDTNLIASESLLKRI